MLDWIFIVFALAVGSAGGDGQTQDGQTKAVRIVEQSDHAGEDAKSSAQMFEADPQTPTGKFTTAIEIKQIMEMTKPNWVALAAQPGNDLLYVTQIWSWRCGLLQMEVSLNGGPKQVWPLPPCHDDTNAPNAITDADGLPFKTFDAGEIETLEVDLLYDDLTTTTASYTRQEILLP